VTALGGGPLTVVVGSGGVGKTTIGAALGLRAAEAGHRTLVMTFDPSLRLKDTLGVGEAARDREVAVDVSLPGSLHASLLDARLTFDRLVERYAPDADSRRRILGNRYYQDLAGGLAGILEYMAVERLYEVWEEKRWDRVVLDTPPTRQALDFLEAPSRIVGFLDSGALRVALKPWFDERGRLRAVRRLGPLGRGFEGWLDQVVGLDLLRDMGEFFQAFGPLYAGFRERARAVEALLASPDTRFVLVAGPGEEKVPDTLFFARRLEEKGYRVAAVIVNRVHPAPPDGEPPPADPVAAARDGELLLRWLGAQDARGVAQLRELVGGRLPLVEVPLLPREPTDLASLQELARRLDR
jgi:anion-transporting  ArsA/GET3 family ATPase